MVPSVVLVWLALHSLAYGAMTPIQIASSLANCPDFSQATKAQELQTILSCFLSIAECDNQTIREGLKIHDAQISPWDKKQINRWFFNRPVLFAVIFQFERGPSNRLPFSGISYLRPPNLPRDSDLEYSVPVEVTPEGRIRLGWYFGGYEGPPPKKDDSVALFDKLSARHGRRKINLENQKNHSSAIDMVDLDSP